MRLPTRPISSARKSSLTLLRATLLRARRSRVRRCSGGTRLSARESGSTTLRVLGAPIRFGPSAETRTLAPQEMFKLFLKVVVSLWIAYCSSAFADENTDKKITDSALRETRDLISRELFGHYDVTTLTVLRIEHLSDRMSLGHDYGLMKVILKFSATRNTTKSPNLNPNLFEPGNAMCRDWLYLHCGVPVGHVFEGKLQILLAIDRNGEWRVVSPNWRSRRQYSLDGYLVLDGRKKEGYVLFPTQ